MLQWYCYFTESRVYHSTIIKCYIRFLFAYLSLRYIFLLANEYYFNKNNGFQWFLYDCYPCTRMCDGLTMCWQLKTAKYTVVFRMMQI